MLICSNLSGFNTSLSGFGTSYLSDGYLIAGIMCTDLFKQVLRFIDLGVNKQEAVFKSIEQPLFNRVPDGIS